MIPLAGRVKQAADMALILIFVAAIGLPCLRGLADLARAVRQGLNLPPEGLAALPVRVEQFVNQHFAFRRTLIHGHSLLKVRWLGLSSCRNVIVGNKGWLFYTSTVPASSRPLQKHELAHWQRVLQARRDWLAQRGVPYLLVIAPDKQSIYPELLPAALQHGPSASRLDQLLSYLQSHSNVAVLDLRGPLLRGKATEQLYHRTDSHWNDRGAFLAYEQIMAALGRWFPCTRALPRARFQSVENDMRGGDLARMLQLEGSMHEICLGLEPQSQRWAHRSGERIEMTERFRLPHLEPVALECPGSLGPRAVMFHDSFAGPLVPFLSEHCSRIVYLPEDVFDPAIVEREQPEVVIQEMVEWKLNGRVPADPPFPAPWTPRAPNSTRQHSDLAGVGK